MKNNPVHIRSGLTLLLLSILILTTVTPAFSQTSPATIVFTSINANESFPEVSLQVKVLDSENKFVQGLDADHFSLSEDGNVLPIDRITSGSLPLDMHVVFVIDELAIGSNMLIVREAIGSFVQNQMLANDSVSVIAAANKNITQVIVPFTSNPEEVVNALESYDPASASGTKLLDAVDQGLDDLAAVNENAAGLNKVVVFSVSIIDQLNLGKTITKASGLSIPIHTVLLSSDDAKGALGRLAIETNAGAGAILSRDINELTSVLDPQRNEEQYLLIYRSQANSSGDHEIVVTVNGAISKDAVFTLNELELPLITITAPDAGTVIVRAETLFSQNPESVQPTEQTVAVEISWPDGHPRTIVQERTVLVVNGRSLGAAQTVRDNGKDPVILEFVWDLSSEQTPGVNEISIVVEAEDELGLKGRSGALPVAVEYVEFGDLSAACPPLIFDNLPALCSNWNLVIPLMSLAVAVVALALVIVYMRRNPKVQERVKISLGTMMTRIGGGERLATRIVTEADSAKATLVLLEGNPGGTQTHFPLNATTTVGRSGDHAQLVLQGDKQGSPISRLHCTILEKDGIFELRDESSANGTHLNDARLPQGKPNRLNDGDTIELARVRDGGIKFKFEMAKKPKPPMKTRIAASDADEELEPKGYTPTMLPMSKEEPGGKSETDGYTPTMPPTSKKGSEDKNKPDGYTPTKSMN